MAEKDRSQDNPFFNRQRIIDPVYFHGRHTQLEALYSAIVTRQSRAIVGERKIGKSSLLTHVSCPNTLRRHGFDPDQFVFIYVDLEGMANLRYVEFWPELVDRLALSLPLSQTDLRERADQMALQDEVRFTQVRRLMRRCERAGLRVVLMLDEFESLAANVAFDASFYGELRSLAGELGVIYITASKRGLYDLTYRHEDTLSSPFFNIFSELPLGLYPDQEASGLLQTLSAHVGAPFTPVEVDFCRQLAGPHPFFLQIAASHLFSLRREPIPDDALREQVRRRFHAEAEDHYRYLWAQLSLEEQNGLRNLSTADPTIRRALQQKALVATQEGLLRPFSRTFNDFITRAGHSAPATRTTRSSSQSGTTDLTGATLGSYRVLSPLGRGGMAVVYKGYQAALDRYVAIKVMSRALAERDTFGDRFQREAASVAQLRHQNVVQMLDFGQVDDLSYMVMEYIEGETLKAYLRRQRAAQQRMPLPDISRVIGDIGAALDYAHAYGLVHRDVKPANIMLRQDARLAQHTGGAGWTAVLTDFGVARMLEGAQFTDTGVTIGTPDYMSPEQAQGEPATSAADIYALGIVLYEMLTGELPFSAETPVAVLLQHMQAEPPSPVGLVPDLPPELDGVLMQALSKQPGNRFPTAGEMIAALQKALR